MGDGDTGEDDGNGSERPGVVDQSSCSEFQGQQDQKERENQHGASKAQGFAKPTAA